MTKIDVEVAYYNRNRFSETSKDFLSLHLGVALSSLISFLHLHLLPSFRNLHPVLIFLPFHVDLPLDLLDLGVNGADGLLEGVDSKVAPGLVFLNSGRLPGLC